MADFMYGSLCLSNIPKRLFKKVMCKDGKERVFLNIKIIKRKEVSQFGNTHFVSCEPKEEKDRIDGEVYICGDLTEYAPQNIMPTAEEIAAAPPFEPMDETDNLPF